MSQISEITNKLRIGKKWKIKEHSMLFKNKTDVFELVQTTRKNLFEIYLNGNPLENQLVFIFERNIHKVDFHFHPATSVDLIFTEIEFVN